MLAKYRETLPNKQRAVSYRRRYRNHVDSHDGLDLLYFSAVDLLKHAADYAAHASVSNMRRDYPAFALRIWPVQLPERLFRGIQFRTALN